MNKVIVLITALIVFGGLVYAGVVSPYTGTKYVEGDTQVKSCLMYGMMTDGTLYPVQVNASGAIKTY